MAFHLVHARYDRETLRAYVELREADPTYGIRSRGNSDEASGRTPAELGVVKQRIEACANPELAKSKAETTRALADAEAGWRSAVRQISERAGLGRPHDGIARAVTAIDAA
jgi:hypothetical protein